MLRGIYSSASAMIAQQRRTEALTNNLANINSTGYKADETIFRTFPEYLLSEVHQERTGLSAHASAIRKSTPIGKLAHGVYTHEMVPDFNQGVLKETRSHFDLAIQDEELAPVEVNGKTVKPHVFFAIEKDGNRYYTRNGNFSLDEENYLITGDGSQVLDRQGNPIRIPTDEYLVDERGFIRDNEGNQLLAGNNPLQIQLVQINDSFSLVKGENGAFVWEGEGEPPLADQGFQIRQGFVESSNVDLQRTMIDFMQSVRSFESNQKVMAAYDDTLTRLFESSRLT